MGALSEGGGNIWGRRDNIWGEVVMSKGVSV